MGAEYVHRGDHPRHLRRGVHRPHEPRRGSTASAHDQSLGTAVGDWSGKFTGTGKISLGGTIVDQTVSGTSVANSDCTGTITYTQKINGQPAPDINIVGHTLDDGKEIRGMSIDPGVNMTCSLRLLSR